MVEISTPVGHQCAANQRETAPLVALISCLFSVSVTPHGSAAAASLTSTFGSR
jgi:hypothetical protein